MVVIMSTKVYISGKLVPKEQATISVYDHGLLYGDGVFEGIRVYGGQVFPARRAHPAALRRREGHPPRNSHALPDDSKTAVDETVAANALKRRLRAAGRHARQRHARGSTSAKQAIRR